MTDTITKRERFALELAKAVLIRNQCSLFEAMTAAVELTDALLANLAATEPQVHGMDVAPGPDKTAYFDTNGDFIKQLAKEAEHGGS